ncbi:MAG: rod shape-determining protein RodA [Bacteroidales bacterium]|nr:rod shape-determining protein RodA [Bacteroidales bacterium]
MIGVSPHTQRSFSKSVDWWLIASYLILVLIGWLNIYASIHTGDEMTSAFSWSLRSGKQLVWIGTAFVLAALVLFVIPPRIYEGLSIPFFGMVLLLLVAVIFLSNDVKGSHSWFQLGPVSFQPAEISKIATSLMLATVMSQMNYKMTRVRDFILTAAIILVPMAIIVLESETGSALVYVGFIFMLYREGLSGWTIFIMFMAILVFILTLVASPYTAAVVTLAAASIVAALYSRRSRRDLLIWIPVVIIALIWGIVYNKVAAAKPESFIASVDKFLFAIPFVVALAVVYFVQSFKERNMAKLLAAVAVIGGIILIFSVQFIFYEVLEDYQRGRIEVLLGMKEDLAGAGYNVNQSLIAIGSGGFFGKGYLNGTQTTFGFVPEQSTDFIFCTIGEEWGFLGSAAVIILFLFLISRIVLDAEKSREAFTRIYGYCVASILFMHLIINIGMTIGFMPVIGIPLPLISYGGSSLWSFTIMIFIFIALDRNESKYF